MPHNHGHGWAAKLRTGGCKLSAKPSLPATLKSEALSFGACCTPYYPGAGCAGAAGSLGSLSSCASGLARLCSSHLSHTNAPVNRGTDGMTAQGSGHATSSRPHSAANINTLRPPCPRTLHNAGRRPRDGRVGSLLAASKSARCLAKWIKVSHLHGSASRPTTDA